MHLYPHLGGIRAFRGFGLWVLGFEVWSSGFALWVVGFEVWALDFGLWDLGF